MKNWQASNMGTFTGRLKHFFSVCAPLKSFNSSQTVKEYNTDVKALYGERADADGKAMLTPKEIEDYRKKKIVLASC